MSWQLMAGSLFHLTQNPRGSSSFSWDFFPQQLHLSSESPSRADQWFKDSRTQEKAGARRRLTNLYGVPRQAEEDVLVWIFWRSTSDRVMRAA